MSLATQHARFGTALARGTRVTLLGIAVSVVLAIVKIASGVVGHTYALIADGVESLLDVFSASVAWGSLRYSARPPDEKHPYGHGKAEALGALVIAAVLLAASLGIAALSIREILTPHLVPRPFTLAVLVGVVVTKELLFRLLLREGRDINSRAVQTDAWHHRSDAITSAAAFIGIAVALYMGPGYAAADDWAALFACGIIAFNGVRLFRAALDDVMDAAPPPELADAVREIAMSIDGVLGTDKCRVRRSGLALFVDLDLIVDGRMSVDEGHQLAHRVKRALLDSPLGVLDVLVHVEPAQQFSEPRTATR
ncbi:MAG TPA: cation diffusion facilitator family transporter [Vicinamibacterales bacterium]